MHTKQILALASVAVIALAASMLLRSNTPLPTPNISHGGAISTTSAITAISTSNSPVSERGSVQPKAKENIAPRAPAQQKVHMKIVAPNGTSEFDVDLREGEDLCENIQEAKSEGHIRSLTIDNSYLATFGSRYVREINGYSNNWTVEVNGVGPKGCSLYDPSDGDSVVWEFGASGN